MDGAAVVAVVEAVAADTAVADTDADADGCHSTVPLPKSIPSSRGLS